MAIELIRRMLCDACGRQDRKEEAEQTVSIADGADASPVLLDLCAGHVESLPVRGLLDLMSAGRPVTQEVSAPPVLREAPAKTPRGKEADQCCPVCWARYTSIGTVGSHVQREHGLSWAPGVGEFITDRRCPLCGEAFGNSVREAPRVTGSHARRAHGVSLSMAYERAHREGDPHGVVATLRSLDELRAHPPGHFSADSPRTGTSKRE